MSETHQDPDGGAVLDIGGDVGALLLRTDAGRLHLEIHVAPVNNPDHRTHTVVRAHPLPDGRVVHAALFPALPAGDYWIVDPPKQTTLTITGGQVTHYDADDCQ